MNNKNGNLATRAADHTQKKVSFKIAKGYLVLIKWLTFYLMRNNFVWTTRVVSSLEKGFDIGNTCCLIYSSGEENCRPDLVYLFRNQCGEDHRVQQQVVGYPEE